MTAGSASASSPPAVRVASIPAAHPYVAGLGLPAAGAVVLPDPPVAGAPPGQWWPPVMLDPDWIATHRDEFDVMHLHFGSESLSRDALAAVLHALRAAGRPLVHTVHDLSHPQLEDQGRHRDHLDLLVTGADALITLTETAADEVERRWSRRPVVFPHPAMLDGPPPIPERLGPDSVVGVHLRDLRPSIDGAGTVEALLAAAARLRTHGRPARVQVFMHSTVRDERQRLRIRGLIAGDGHARLIEQPRPDDTELHRELAGLSATVLPYRHGTHSGWLELCWDLGVPVAAPDIGHFAGQHPGDGGSAVFRSGDADSLAGTLATLLARPESRAGAPARAQLQHLRRQVRVRQRARLGQAHLELYRSVMAAAAGSNPA